MDEVGEALQMNSKDFREKYNEVKPSKSDRLVFSCLAGARSKKALDTAVSLGFNRYIDERSKWIQRLWIAMFHLCYIVIGLLTNYLELH